MNPGLSWRFLGYAKNFKKSDKLYRKLINHGQS